MKQYEAEIRAVMTRRPMVIGELGHCEAGRYCWVVCSPASRRRAFDTWRAAINHAIAVAL